MNNSLTTRNPSTGQVLERYPYMSDDEVERAVERCHTSFLSWRHTPTRERAQYMRQIGRSLSLHQNELARLMSREMGKPLVQGHQEIELCKQICNYTADHGPDALADETRDIADGKQGIVTYQALGVIYGIQPWNFPAYQVIRYSIANLMAGNGVLLKHAENVTGSGLMLERLYEESGLPAGLFCALRISHAQSDNVIEHPHVRGVTLTGSPEAGRHIAAKAGGLLKKTVLELGSNDAYVVLEDADLPRAVEQCVQGRVANNGETCIAAKRFIVVDEVYEAFRSAYVDAMKALTLGDPLESDVELGPMAREDLRDKLHAQVERSVERGARLLCGGELPKGPGFFYPPTVLEQVRPGQPAYDEELFGPVAALIRARDTTDAFRIANDSRFGLGGAVFSENRTRAIELATKHFDTGMVFINGFGLASPSMPFGGVKDSGYGREHGTFGLKEFVNAKSVLVMD